VSLPTKLDAKDAATKARLEKLSGKAFDRAYMRDMVLDHTKDVREFRMESKTAKDSSVKNFAAQTLPTLEDHLKEAKSIEPKVVPHHTQRQKGTT
jgi:putative membrane protein